jgi:hypothetical protein
MGGGAAYASLRLFDKGGNNVGQSTIFSSLPQFSELAPSRIMFDGAHWQSEVSVTKSAISTSRYENTVKVRDVHGVEHDTTYIVAPAWSHPDRFNAPAEISSPNYSKLPPTMRPKIDAGDPVPPTRTISNQFYQTSWPCEYISDINSIIEDVDPDPLNAREISVMDTLYKAVGAVIRANNGGSDPLHPAPTMTYYHGNTAHQFVFTGFAPWSYARQDCMALVDFVLQDLWGLTRQNIDRGSFTPALRSGVPPAQRVVRPAQRVVSSSVPSGTNRE